MGMTPGAVVKELIREGSPTTRGLYTQRPPKARGRVSRAVKFRGLGA